MSATIASRTALRRPTHRLQVRTPKQQQLRYQSTTEQASQKASEAGSKAKEAAGQAKSKASEGLSRVQSSAGSAMKSTSSALSNAVSRIGGPIGRLVGAVEGELQASQELHLDDQRLSSLEDLDRGHVSRSGADRFFSPAAIPPTMYYSRVGLELSRLVFQGQKMSPP